ncbi:hypothetical protein ACJX0J_041667, partial [Zea mays]
KGGGEARQGKEGEGWQGPQQAQDISRCFLRVHVRCDFSPPASAPARAEEDSMAGAAPARSDGSTDDAAAVAQKDQGADKPSSAVAESSKRRKEPEQQQPAAPWAKLLSQCSQMVVIDE